MINSSISKAILFCCWLLLSYTSLAQDVIDIEDRLAWEYNSDEPKSYMISLTPGVKINSQYSNVPFLRIFTSGAWDRIVRLNFENTILLVGIPEYDPKLNKSHLIYSMRYSYEEATETYIALDECSTEGVLIFGEEVTQDILMQLPRKPFFKELDATIYATSPEELHIELREGDYGNATLIYTTQSATPEIIFQ